MISIVIVNYNAGRHLAQCLASIQRNVTLPHEIVVVDNASTDGSLETLSPAANVRVLREKVNWGFAKACNLGARMSQGDVLHFLNPDTEVGADINQTYEQVADGIYSTKIVDQNGIETKVNFAFPTFENLYRMLISRQTPSYWFIGASVLLRSSTFAQLGGFSEDYTLYAEDEDLFYKAHLKGVAIRQLEARVVHIQGASSKQIWNARQRLLRVEASGRKFAAKFGLRFSYFVFRHLGFAKGLFHDPTHTLLELVTFWQVMLFPMNPSLPGGR